MEVVVYTGTPVSGAIATSTWTSENNPYVVAGPITVPSGETLTIEPGVEVVFAEDVRFDVEGALLALGTEADSIAFEGSYTGARWEGISITGGDSSSLGMWRSATRGNESDGTCPCSRVAGCTSAARTRG